ncbi:MAG: hypothetical protein ACLQSR_10050 [Limisphaerales bacterium]
MTDAKPIPNRARTISRRLKWTGGAVLALGILSAGLIYWLGSRNDDLSNDPSMLGFNRAEERQMGQLYGSSGELMDDLMDDLKQPGTQAILIVLVSGLAAAGCFYFARLVAIDDEPTE